MGTEQVGTAAPLEEAFLADLKRVGEVYERLPHGLRPSLRTLAHLAGGKSPTTISNWLTGEVFPGSGKELATVVARIQQAARAVGTSTADLVHFHHAWAERHEAILKARLRDAEQLRRGKQAAVELAAAAAEARRAALTDKPRPLPSWTPAQLRVHPSISGTNEPVDGFVLPAYVERNHDARLRETLRRAAESETPALILVRGDSCTGKTRAAFEALHQAPALERWNLIFPRTGAGLLEALAAGALASHTVLWFDDAHKILAGRTGEAVAASLHSRLAEPGPLIVAGTIWTNFFTELTQPSAGQGVGGSDPHRHARELLTAATTVITIAPRFQDEDLRALRATAQSANDPALKAADRSVAKGKVTQTLAAGLQLVDRYEAADAPPGCYYRAIISAAMDACRLGWDAPLPEAFLREAACGYLTDDQRASAEPTQWFETALEEARTKLLGVAAALEPVPHPTGMGARPGVWRLTDYLDAHGRATRRRYAPPPSFWTVAAQHATSAEHLNALAREAEARRRYRAAELLFQRSAEAGDPHAYTVLMMRRDQAGDRSGAEHFAQRAAEAGYPRAYAELALEPGRNLKETERLLQRGADAGDPLGCVVLAVMRERAGDRSGAESLARRAAQGGNPRGYTALAEMCGGAGDWPGAERFARLAAQGGNPRGYTVLAEMCGGAGDWPGAERFARLAAQSGDTRGYTVLAEMRQQDRQQAEHLLQCAVQAGNHRAYIMLAVMRGRAGDWPGAEHLARRAADAGAPLGYTALAGMRQEDDRQEAERLYRCAAQAGEPIAHKELVLMRQQDLDEAYRLAKRAADAGDRLARDRLAAMRKERRLEAYQLMRPLADAGEPIACASLAEMCEEDGDRASSERFAHRAALRGYKHAYTTLAEMCEEAGDRQGAEHFAHLAAEIGYGGTYASLARRRTEDSQEAQRLTRLAAEAGEPQACTDLAEKCEEAGDRPGAERFARLAADAGNPRVYVHLAVMCEKAGDRPGSERFARLAADAGDTRAYDDLAVMCEKAGDRPGGERFARLAADSGNPHTYTYLAHLRRNAGDGQGAERLSRTELQ